MNFEFEIEDRKPQYQFRGIFLPAEIVMRIVNGELNSTDIAVLVVVESLVKHKGEGCYATNQYLADAAGKSKMFISETISKLVKMGLLVSSTQIVQKRHIRYLETCWSRTANEPTFKSPEGEGVRVKPLGGGKGETLTPTIKSIKYKTVTKRNGGFSPISFGTNATSSISDNAKVLSKEFYESLFKRNKITTTRGRHKWAGFIEELLKVRSYDKVKHAIEWIPKNLDRDEFVPQIQCAKQLLERFVNVEKAMKRYGEWPFPEDDPVIDDYQNEDQEPEGYREKRST
jgi:hypothetical protein